MYGFLRSPYASLGTIARFRRDCTVGILIQCLWLFGGARCLGRGRIRQARLLGHVPVLLAAQVGQYGQHAAVIGLALGEAELAEDAFYVLLHRPVGDEERLRYGPVGAPLGDEG